MLVEMSRVNSAKARGVLRWNHAQAHARRQIRALFISPDLETALLREVNRLGPDAGLVMNLMRDAHLRVARMIQVAQVTPVVQAVQAPAANPAPATAPAPRRLQGDGSSEESPVEVLDSDDELFEEINLTLDQEERVRRHFRRIRSETSADSSQ